MLIRTYLYRTVYSYSLAVINDQMKDNLYYRIHHNLTKMCWFMLDFVFQSPFLIFINSQYKKILYYIISPSFLSRYYLYRTSLMAARKSLYNITFPSRVMAMAFRPHVHSYAYVTEFAKTDLWAQILKSIFRLKTKVTLRYYPETPST